MEAGNSECIDGCDTPPEQKESLPLPNEPGDFIAGIYDVFQQNVDNVDSDSEHVEHEDISNGVTPTYGESISDDERLSDKPNSSPDVLLNSEAGEDAGFEEGTEPTLSGDTFDTEDVPDDDCCPQSSSGGGAVEEMTVETCNQSPLSPSIDQTVDNEPSPIVSEPDAHLDDSVNSSVSSVHKNICLAISSQNLETTSTHSVLNNEGFPSEEIESDISMSPVQSDIQKPMDITDNDNDNDSHVDSLKVHPPDDDQEMVEVSSPAKEADSQQSHLHLVHDAKLKSPESYMDQDEGPLSPADDNKYQDQSPVAESNNAAPYSPLSPCPDLKRSSMSPVSDNEDITACNEQEGDPTDDEGKGPDSPSSPYPYEELDSPCEAPVSPSSLAQHDDREAHSPGSPDSDKDNLNSSEPFGPHSPVSPEPLNIDQFSCSPSPEPDRKSLLTSTEIIASPEYASDEYETGRGPQTPDSDAGESSADGRLDSDIAKGGLDLRTVGQMFLKKLELTQSRNNSDSEHVDETPKTKRSFRFGGSSDPKSNNDNSRSNSNHSSQNRTDDIINKTGLDDHGELDYDDDDEAVPSSDIKRLPSREDGVVDTEKPEASDDGEVDDDDDCEEGEIKEPDGRRPFVKPTCRFFMRGHCTWGSSCRFLHPGINDKGNWTLLDTPSVYNNNVNRGPPPRPQLPDEPEIDEPLEEEEPLPPPSPEEPRPETAWERGLRQAKEMRLRAQQRKQKEINLVEKRMTMTFEEDRDYNKENERIYKDPYYDADYSDDEYYNQEVKKSYRDGQYENFEVRSTRNPDVAIGITNRVERVGGEPLERERVKDRYRSPTALPAGPIKLAAVPGYNRVPREHGTSPVPPTGQPVSSAAVPVRKRADEWHDPWRRSKSPNAARKKRSTSRDKPRGRRRYRLYSRGSYSSSSSSFSGSSRSRSSSYSSSYSSSSSSRSPSPNFARKKARKAAATSPRATNISNKLRKPLLGKFPGDMSTKTVSTAGTKDATAKTVPNKVTGPKSTATKLGSTPPSADIPSKTASKPSTQPMAPGGKLSEVASKPQPKKKVVKPTAASMSSSNVFGVGAALAALINKPDDKTTKHRHHHSKRDPKTGARRRHNRSSSFSSSSYSSSGSSSSRSRSSGSRSSFSSSSSSSAATKYSPKKKILPGKEKMKRPVPTAGPNPGIPPSKEKPSAKVAVSLEVVAREKQKEKLVTVQPSIDKVVQAKAAAPGPVKKMKPPVHEVLSKSGDRVKIGVLPSAAAQQSKEAQKASVKPGIRLTLIKKQPSDKNVLKRAAENPLASPPAKKTNKEETKIEKDTKAKDTTTKSPIAKLKTVPAVAQAPPAGKAVSKKPIEANTAVPKPAAVPLKEKKKSSVCRREELLKQLKAVEDAIAKKRAKFT